MQLFVVFRKNACKKAYENHKEIEMIFRSVDDAIRALEDLEAGKDIHRQAIRYLASLDECFAVEGLVEALQNDDFGVRWEAASLLSKIGAKALPALLKALMDPVRVGDPRLREGALHIVCNFQDPEIDGPFSGLIHALTGPAADINTMRAAYRLLHHLELKDCGEGVESEQVKSSSQAIGLLATELMH